VIRNQISQGLLTPPPKKPNQPPKSKLTEEELLEVLRLLLENPAINKKQKAQEKKFLDFVADATSQGLEWLLENVLPQIPTFLALL